MIVPTEFSKHTRTISPDQAARLVTWAIIRQPKRVSTRLGSLGQMAYFLFPSVMVNGLSWGFRRSLNSDAAEGITDVLNEAKPTISAPKSR